MYFILASFDCNFETGVCSSWLQDTTDQLDWSIGQGSTSSFGTGPTVDHTLKNGKKILVLLKPVPDLPLFEFKIVNTKCSFCCDSELAIVCDTTLL